jgi:methyl-accepting chemotaxis protein
MGAEPDQIRQQIAQTRTEMGDTIDAIGYKADVPARAKDKVTGTVDRARDSLAGTMDSLKDAVTGTASSVRDATPDAGQVSGQARHAVGVAQQNPLGLAIGSVAAGFLLGMVLPGTRVEDERIGAAADHVKELAAEVGHEAMEHGKEVAQEAIDRGTEVAREAAATVQDSAGDHVAELRDSAMEHADKLKGDVAEQTSEMARPDPTVASRPAQF